MPETEGVRLKECHKIILTGTQRAVGFEETISRVRSIFPELGITRVADITGLDRIGIPVWIACRPNSRSLSVSQGKGTTAIAAQASAIMECLELHHAERPNFPLRLASTLELQSQKVSMVDVSRLPGTKASRYSPGRPMLWAEATDMFTESKVWVPYEVVHTSALVPPPTGSGCFSSTSNGVASGNHILEATVHALCEVIERDAAAVWQCLSLEKRLETLVDLTTVQDPDCQHVLKLFAAAEIGVTVFDITSDINIPAFLCEISDQTVARPTNYSGMGCHLDPEIALLRALTEAAQSRLTYITGSRDDIFRDDYRAVRKHFGLGPISQPEVVQSGKRMRDAMKGVSASITFNQDIILIKDCLERVGLSSILSVDLSKPEFGIPVVRIIIPGLESPDDDPSYIPGLRALSAKKQYENGALI